MRTEGCKIKWMRGLKLWLVVKIIVNIMIFDSCLHLSLRIKDISRSV